MTNLEAIKGKLGYPLSDNAFKVALADRVLTDSATYTKCQAFDLAYADAIVMIITKGNVSEGGFTVSMAEVKTLTSLANGIYAQYGIASPLPKPTAKFVQRW